MVIRKSCMIAIALFIMLSNVLHPAAAQYDLEGAVFVFDISAARGLYPPGFPQQLAIYQTTFPTFEAITPRDIDRSCPTWSSDGTQIAFTRYSDATNSDIYIINADGSNERQVTNFVGDEIEIDWSPISSAIVFSRVAADFSQRDIVLLDTRTGMEMNLTPGTPSSEWHPVFSRTGSEILFLSNRTGLFRLHTLAIDGSNVQEIPLPSDVRVIRARWSPTDDRIIFAGGVGDVSNELFIVNRDGTGLRQLTTGLIEFGSFIWAPDGSGVFINDFRFIEWASANADQAQTEVIGEIPSQYSYSTTCMDIYFPQQSTLTATATLARPAPGQPLRAVLTQSGVVRGDTTGPANANGAIVLPSVSYGAYDLWLKHAQHLAASVPTTVSGPTTTVSVGALRTGDANNDNAVNITDFSIVAATYGKLSSTPGFDPRADFNGDQAVNITDYSLMAANFGRIGAPDPAPLPPPPAMADAVAGTIALTLRPAAVTTRIGREFILRVRAQAGDQPFDSAAFTLTYDPAALEVVSVTPGAALPFLLAQDIQPGRISYAAGALEGPVTGAPVLLTVRLRALAAGSSTVTVAEGDVRFAAAPLFAEGGTVAVSVAP